MLEFYPKFYSHWISEDFTIFYFYSKIKAFGKSICCNKCDVMRGKAQGPEKSYFDQTRLIFILSDQQRELFGTYTHFTDAALFIDSDQYLGLGPMTGSLSSSVRP